MYRFWKNNKNVISVGLSLFVVSVTALMVMLNHEDIAGDLKTNLVHGDSDHAAEKINIEYGPYPEMGEEPAVIVGMDGLIETANDKYGESALFSPSEIEGQLFFNYIHPEDLAGVLSSYGKVLSSGDPQVLVGPFRMKNGAGGYTVNMASMQPVKDDQRLTGVAIKLRFLQSNDIPEARIDIEYDENPEESLQNKESLTSDESLSNGSSGQASESDISAESEDDVKDQKLKDKQKEASENDTPPARTETPASPKAPAHPELPGKNEKQIRNSTNGDKRLVVDNLAKMINKVYRDPDVLAYLF